MIRHFSQEPFEGTFHIEDADLQKMAKMLGDVNIKECPYFDLSDKYGNSARYYRENQWIPVSERLPRMETDVLLQFSRNMCVGFLNQDNDWKIYSGGCWFTDILEGDLQPTAWMPLPEPYDKKE